MSGGAAKAAIFFASDFINESKKGIKGRQSAHEGFLKGFARYATADELIAFAPNAGKIESFASFVRRHDPLTRPTRGVLWSQPEKLADIGVLQLADPCMVNAAWTRRAIGDEAFSLVGLIHTLSSDGVMRLLRSYASAPLFDWDALICTSDAGRQVVEAAFEEGEGFLRERFGSERRPPRPLLPVIPLGVHVDDYAPTPARRSAGEALRRELGVAPEEVVFLFFGRLSFHAKAHPMAMMQAIELAAQRCKTPMRLLFVGQFPNPATAAEYQSLANALCRRSKVTFLDGSDLVRAQAAWSASDVFLSLSDNIQETFGLTIVEALAAGLPVIASDWNGYRQSMVHGETGMMIPTWAPPPGAGAELSRDYDIGLLTYDRFIGAASQSTAIDIGAAAAAAAALAEDPALRARMGQAAAARAEAMDWKALIPQYEALWGELNARRVEAVGMAHPAKSLPDPFTLFSGYPTAVLSPDDWVKAGPDAGAAVKRVLTFGMNRFAAAYLAPAELLRRMAEMVSRAGGVTLGGLTAALPELSAATTMRCIGWLLKVGALEMAREAAFDPYACKQAFDEGVAAFQAGDKTKAIGSFRRALTAQPDYEPALRNLIISLKSAEAHQDAIFIARCWAGRRPDSFHAWHDLARVLLANSALDDAKQAFEKALALNDGDALAWNGYGLCLRRQMAPEAARAALARSLDLNPFDVNALANMGNTYLDQHQPDEALVYYRRILEIKPNAMEGITNIGAAERRAGLIDDAVATYKKGLAIYPEEDSLRHNMCMAMLGSGKFTEGWDHYRARPSSTKQRRIEDRWTKEAVAGKKILIEWEQGLGDELFFLRFWPAAAALGADLYYRPNPKLKPLLARSPQFANRLVEINAKVSADITVGVGDLPWLTGHCDGAPIPPSIGLTPDKAQTIAIAEQLKAFGPPPYIGVAWRGGTPDKGATLFKETPLARLAEALKDVKGTIVIVQRRPNPGEVEAFQAALGRPSLDCCAYNEDFDQVFALVAQLHDLVGVSNTNVHLRETVGLGCRVLVPNPPDFRWMQSGSPSPWFPHSTVYRQLTNGNWDGAYAALRADLTQGGRSPEELVQADAFHAEAKQAYADGALVKAEHLCRRALEIAPTLVSARVTLGAALLAAGRLKEARVEADAALGLDQKSSAAWTLRGSALQAMGRGGDALKSFRKAAALEPNKPELYANIGSVLSSQGHYGYAEEAFEKAKEGAPNHPGVWSTYANFQFNFKNYAEAEAASRRASELEPNNPLHLNSVAQCLLLQEKFEEAITYLRQCLALAPNSTPVRRSLIAALIWTGDFDAAEQEGAITLQQDPHDWRALLAMGDIALRRANKEQGLAYFEKAASLAASEDIVDISNMLAMRGEPSLAMALMERHVPKATRDKAIHARNLAGIKASQGDVDGAVSDFQAACDYDPDDRVTNENFSLFLLGIGQFERAWPHYLKRRSTHGYSKHLWHEALPQDLSGRRILLGRDQGVGDELFFLRFARELKRRGAWIGYVASPTIFPLAQQLPELDQVSTTGAEIPGCDMRVSLGDAPALLQMNSIEMIPPPIQLRADPARMEKMRAALAAAGPGPYLALAWQAGAFNARSLYKTAPPELMAEVIGAWPGTCVMVQRRPLANDVAHINKLSGKKLADFSDVNKDLEEMAAFLAVVDEMVCVSNTNVHLRAALGRFSRVLIPSPPDFRWMWSGDHSPWYPDHPLYRQSTKGTWTSAGRKLIADLQASASGVA